MNNISRQEIREYLHSILATLKRIRVKLIFTIISLSFIGYSIAINFDRLKQESININSLLLIFSAIFVTSLSVFINAYAWKYLLKWLNFRDVKLSIVRIFVKTNILKYMPGGVWHFTERLRQLNKNYSFKNSIIAVTLEPFLMIWSAMLLIVLGDWSVFIKFLFFLPFLLLIKSIRNLLINPFKYILSYNINKLNGIGLVLEKISLLNLNKLDKSLFFKSLMIEIIFIIFRFLGFWLCIYAFNIHEYIYFLNWLSVFSIAWVIGLIVPAAPGGVGVFESVVMFLMIGFPEQAPLIASLLCYRLVSMLADVISFLLVILKDYISKIKYS